MWKLEFLLNELTWNRKWTNWEWRSKVSRSNVAGSPRELEWIAPAETEAAPRTGNDWLRTATWTGTSNCRRKPAKWEDKTLKIGIIKCFWPDQRWGREWQRRFDPAAWLQRPRLQAAAGWTRHTAAGPVLPLSAPSSSICPLIDLPFRRFPHHKADYSKWYERTKANERHKTQTTHAERLIGDWIDEWKLGKVCRGRKGQSPGGTYIRADSQEDIKKGETEKEI